MGFFVKRRQICTRYSVRFHGKKIAYEIKGKGKPVILLHGSMIYNPWKGFDDFLSKHFRVYLPHLPGFGGSDGVEGRIHNTDLFSEGLCAFIEEKKLEKAPLVALSLGTVVAVKSALQGCYHGSLVLVGTPFALSSEKLRRASLLPLYFRRFLASTVIGRKNVLLPVLWSVIGRSGNRTDNELMHDLETTDVRSLVDLDVYEEVDRQMPDLVKRLKNKTLFIYGEKDGLLVQAKKCVINPIIIKNASHNCFGSHPEETLMLIKKFI